MFRVIKIAVVSLLIFLVMSIGISIGVVLQIAATEETREISYEEAVISAAEGALPSVVSVVASKDILRLKGDMLRQEMGGGSGFVISKEGLILTNRHVVYDEKADYMVFADDGRSFPAKVLAVDPVYDLAVLKIEGGFLPPIKIGFSDNLRIGQTAIAVGNALGELHNTVSVGVVSGLGRSVFATKGRELEILDSVIQTDAGVNRGNSGGPLLNLKGEVIGINTAMAIGAQNIGFAIPIDDAKRAIRGAIEKGEIVYPFLGVYYVPIEEDSPFSVSYGAFISRVEPQSGAFNAGIKKEDIILEINGTRVGHKNSLARLVMRSDPGDSISILLLRGEEEFLIEAVLGERRY